MTFAVAPGAVVIDASAAVQFVQGDVAWHARWQGWLASETMVLVPPHFPFEIANALLHSVRLDPDDIAERLSLLSAMGIETADRGQSGLVASIRLGHRHRLTVYDAAYLHLALDVDGQLATLDRKLAAAAKAEGVEVVAPD